MEDILTYQDLFPAMSFSEYVLNQDLIDEFLSHVKRDPESECLLWNAPEVASYYTFRRQRVQRVAYELANGLALESTQRVRHTCKNVRCVNPEHLTLLSTSKEAAVPPRSLPTKSPVQKEPGLASVLMMILGQLTELNRILEQQFPPRKSYIELDRPDNCLKCPLRVKGTCECVLQESPEEGWLTWEDMQKNCPIKG